MSTPSAIGRADEEEDVSSTTNPSTQESSGVFTAAVVTVSDSCARGERVDLSGPAVAEALKKSGFRVVASRIVQDDSMPDSEHASASCTGSAIRRHCRWNRNCAARCNPRSTEAICDRLIDGVAERMRLEGSKKTSFAALSRESAECAARLLS